MKNIKLGLLAVPLAMGVTALPAIAQETIQKTIVTYQCSDGQIFQAEFLPERVEITLSEDKTLVLSQTESGSGTRYSDGDTTFAIQGNEAFIEVNDEIVYSDCVPQRVSSSSEATQVSRTEQTTTTQSVLEKTPSATSVRAL
ncbi:MliC family protein [Lyngbya aestuarii]|uniref:MliC family protein n=1 Tax=Lyngbya aestuarii TaxID=118322 RepID=UPI00403E069C